MQIDSCLRVFIFLRPNQWSCIYCLFCKSLVLLYFLRGNLVSILNWNLLSIFYFGNAPVMEHEYNSRFQLSDVRSYIPLKIDTGYGDLSITYVWAAMWLEPIAEHFLSVATRVMMRLMHLEPIFMHPAQIAAQSPPAVFDFWTQFYLRHKKLSFFNNINYGFSPI